MNICVEKPQYKHALSLILGFLCIKALPINLYVTFICNFREIFCFFGECIVLFIFRYIIKYTGFSSERLFLWTILL